MDPSSSEPVAGQLRIRHASYHQNLPQKATIVAKYTPQRLATGAAIEPSFSYLKALTQEEHNA
jgi:hypothetical protein